MKQWVKTVASRLGRRRHGLLAAAGVAALIAGILFAVRPPPAVASPTFRPGDLVAFLPTDMQVRPHDARAIPYFGVRVLWLTLTMQAGESRILTSRLGLTINTDEGAEMDDSIQCLDLINGGDGEKVSNAHSHGTNHMGASAGELILQGSYVLTAPHAGQYRCELLTDTSDDASHTDYVMTVKAATTYLAAGSVAEVGAVWWQNNTCDSEGMDDNCIYLGVPGGPTSRNIFMDDDGTQAPDGTVLRATWIAPTSALTLEVIADLEITTCHGDTSSCEDGKRGSDHFSTIFAGLEFDQLDPAGAVCRIFGTPQTQYRITEAVHHLTVRLALGDVPVASTCGGSRQFRVSVPVRWFSGNPVKIEGSNGFRSAVHASAIVKSYDTTTTVPGVTSLAESAAGDAIRAAGLVVGTVTRVPNAAAAKTVLAQNAPSTTIEPVGSKVDLTVSAGPTPDVLGMTETAATDAIQAAQLSVGTITRVMNPAQMGTVIGQSPAGWTVLPAYTAVDLTVSLGQSVVPNIIGLSNTAANDALNTAGLTPNMSQQKLCNDPGRVINQNPSVGAVVPRGSSVFFVFDTGTLATCPNIE